MGIVGIGGKKTKIKFAKLLRESKTFSSEIWQVNKKLRETNFVAPPVFAYFFVPSPNVVMQIGLDGYTWRYGTWFHRTILVPSNSTWGRVLGKTYKNAIKYIWRWGLKINWKDQAFLAKIYFLKIIIISLATFIVSF